MIPIQRKEKSCERTNLRQEIHRRFTAHHPSAFGCAGETTPSAAPSPITTETPVPQDIVLPEERSFSPDIKEGKITMLVSASGQIEGFTLEYELPKKPEPIEDVPEEFESITEEAYWRGRKMGYKSGLEEFDEAKERYALETDNVIALYSSLCDPKLTSATKTRFAGAIKTALETNEPQSVSSQSFLLETSNMGNALYITVVYDPLQ